MNSIDLNDLITKNTPIASFKMDKLLNLTNNNNINVYKKLIHDNEKFGADNILTIDENIEFITNTLKIGTIIPELQQIQQNLYLLKEKTQHQNKQIIDNNTKIISFLNSTNKKQNNKKNIKNDDDYNGVSIVIAIYSLNNKLYIGCHFDNTQTQYRYKTISACGGHVDEGESYIDAAIREAKEEHGLTINNGNKLKFISKNYNEKTGKCYKYFSFDVKPTDYLTSDILTPHEVFQEEEYINNVFSQFPKNSVIKTGASSTYLIDLDVLTCDLYEKYLYKPFFHFLKKFKENK